MSSYVYTMTTPRMTKNYVVRGDFFGSEPPKSVESVLKRRLSDFIAECRSEFNVKGTRSLYLCGMELVKQDPDGQEGWSTASHINMEHGGVRFARTVIRYREGANRVYYAAQFELSEKDVSATGTGPCIEEKPSSAAEVILSKMRKRSEAMTKLEREMTALVQEMRDLE